jgi:hypothetical protein
VGIQHINSSTHTANVGLNKIQFRAIHCVGAGSRMLESVFQPVPLKNSYLKISRLASK